MSSQYFSKDFASQFRNEIEVYSPAGEFQFGKICIKQFKGNDSEMPETAKKLAARFFNSGNIRQILFVLKNGNLPVAGSLYKNLTALKSQLEGYLQAEPYTAHFYNERIAMLHSFSELIDGFYKDFSEQVCGQLNKYYNDICEQAECVVADSSSLSDIIGLTEYYLKSVLSYYNYFIITWQFEANNTKGIQLTTYMADHLQSLIVHVEEMIVSLEEARSLLLGWEEKMQIHEEQELYN